MSRSWLKFFLANYQNGAVNHNGARNENYISVSFFRYDKTLRPNFGGNAVKVGITMNLDSLGPIDEVNMHFRVDISFRQFWRDSRLDFSLYDELDYAENLTLSHEFLEKVKVNSRWKDGIDCMNRPMHLKILTEVLENYCTIAMYQKV